MALTKVELFSLPVTDQDRSRDFYVGVLGFELVRDEPMRSCAGSRSGRRGPRRRSPW